MDIFLARNLTPLTVLMWALIVIGAIDYFVVGFISPGVQEVGLVALWLLTGAIWFGWKARKREQAEAARQAGGEGA